MKPRRMYICRVETLRRQPWYSSSAWPSHVHCRRRGLVCSSPKRLWPGREGEEGHGGEARQGFWPSVLGVFVCDREIPQFTGLSSQDNHRPCTGAGFKVIDRTRESTSTRSPSLFLVPSDCQKLEPSTFSPVLLALNLTEVSSKPGPLPLFQTIRGAKPAYYPRSNPQTGAGSAFETWDVYTFIAKTRGPKMSLQSYNGLPFTRIKMRTMCWLSGSSPGNVAESLSGKLRPRSGDSFGLSATLAYGGGRRQD